jgi:hypothetical protein
MRFQKVSLSTGNRTNLRWLNSIIPHFRLLTATDETCNCCSRSPRRFLITQIVKRSVSEARLVARYETLLWFRLAPMWGATLLRPSCTFDIGFVLQANYKSQLLQIIRKGFHGHKNKSSVCRHAHNARRHFFIVFNVCLNSRRLFVLCLVYIPYLVLVLVSRDKD